MPVPDDLLSLDELSVEVTRLLEERGLLGASADHRVSPAPDARTIRYYTTLGLLDRPVVQGRQARYGRRHLLQLLTVKALQSQGKPLGEIQGRLYGRTEAELQAVLDAIPAPSQPPASPSGATIPILRWREVTIEPGLKLVVEEGWAPTLDDASRQDRIRTTLSALEAEPRNAERRKNP